MRITYRGVLKMMNSRTKRKRTEPMARKNEKVAALLNMYWERVDMAPLGPGPALVDLVSWRTGIGTCNDEPNDAIRPKDEADGKPNTATHHCAHSAEPEQLPISFSSHLQSSDVRTSLSKQRSVFFKLRR